MEFRVEVVPVPVTDVDRAKAFYAGRLGFTVDVDHAPNEAFRVVQVTPPGSGCSLLFGTNVTAMAPGSLQGVQLSVADVDAAQAFLAGQGVAVTPVQHFVDGGFADGRGEDWNSWCFFEDPDGNRWAVQESPVLRAAAASAG